MGGGAPRPCYQAGAIVARIGRAVCDGHHSAFVMNRGAKMV